MNEEEPTPVYLTATCRTPGCPVEDEPFTAQFYANAEPPTYRCICLPCRQPVTDLAPVAAPVDLIPQ